MKARALSMLIGSVLAGGVQAQSAPQAQAPLPTGAAAPVYQAEPCCNLCPAALVKENYKGDVLSTLWPLVAVGSHLTWFFLELWLTACV